MSTTRDSSQTVVERIKRDSAFATALLDGVRKGGARAISGQNLNEHRSAERFRD